jgi:hypothetical protein
MASAVVMQDIGARGDGGAILHVAAGPVDAYRDLL